MNRQDAKIAKKTEERRESLMAITAAQGISFMETALKSLIRKYRLVFGYLATSEGEIVARVGKVSDKRFRDLVGTGERHWARLDPAGIVQRYNWVAEVARENPAMVPRMTRLGELYLLHTVPKLGLFAVLGGAMSDPDVLALHRLSQEVHTLLVSLLAEC